MKLAQDMSEEFGIRETCLALGVAESTFFRHKNEKNVSSAPTTRKQASAKKLSEAEEGNVLEMLNSERFADHSVLQVYYTLLDEGTYLCSARTMYRVLDRHQAVRERRSQLRHPEYKKPVLRATAPCQLWSWDITKLPTCEKWRYIHLYVILDVYSRAVVGWLASMTESAISAEKLIRETCEKEGIDRNQLTIHADRGAAMKSKAVSQLLADLGVEQSHSRPRVSNDNPFSESHFKTLKYSPEFPEKFSTVEGARSFLGGWFDWYNNHHRHSGIAMMTPAMVHQGQAPSVSLARQAVLENAFLDHPVRFGSKKPTPPVLPLEVWINNPTRQFSLVPA